MRTDQFAEILSALQKRAIMKRGPKVSLRHDLASDSVFKVSSCLSITMTSSSSPPPANDARSVGLKIR